MIEMGAPAWVLTCLILLYQNLGLAVVLVAAGVRVELPAGSRHGAQ